MGTRPRARPAVALPEQQTLQGCTATDSAIAGYSYDIARPSPANYFILLHCCHIDIMLEGLKDCTFV